MNSVISDIQASVPPLVACWSCKGPVDARALFCSTCGAVQGPGNVDHFTRLGVRPSFELDLADLERHYFGFQRRLHPDRFATRTPKERALSQQQATALNEAYETLKDPVKRAGYMLALSGHPVEACATIDDPELLMEQMELREQLAEAEDRAAVDKIAAHTEAEILTVQCALSVAFAHSDLEGAAHHVTRLKYLAKLADEVRARRARMPRDKV